MPANSELTVSHPSSLPDLTLHYTTSQHYRHALDLLCCTPLWFQPSYQGGLELCPMAKTYIISETDLLRLHAQITIHEFRMSSRQGALRARRIGLVKVHISRSPLSGVPPVAKESPVTYRFAAPVRLNFTQQTVHKKSCSMVWLSTVY